MNDFKEPQGINFRCEERIPVDELSATLCNVLSFLQADAPYVTLLQYDDWWEHDGLHFLKGSTDFHKVFEITKTPRSLYEAMPGDHEVRIGIAPDDFKWYLRMFADWDESDAKLEGDFDITLPTEQAHKFRTDIVPSLPCKMVEERSDIYFRMIKE
jgi:hypothetical protein